MDVKKCNGCGLYKPEDEFHWRYKAKKLRASECKPCMAKRNKNWYDSTNARERLLKKKYGMSLEDYDQMLASQQHGCKICGTNKPMNNTEYLCVDHCHTTGKVRGLLCSKCNSAIGLFDEDLDRMRLAMQYLGAA